MVENNAARRFGIQTGFVLVGVSGERAKSPFEHRYLLSTPLIFATTTHPYGAAHCVKSNRVVWSENYRGSCLQMLEGGPLRGSSSDQVAQKSVAKKTSWTTEALPRRSARCSLKRRRDPKRNRKIRWRGLKEGQEGGSNEPHKFGVGLAGLEDTWSLSTEVRRLTGG